MNRMQTEGVSVSFRERDMCGHKVKFTSKKKARAALASMRKRGNMHAYQCPYCFKWHIGHGNRELSGARAPRRSERMSYREMLRNQMMNPSDPGYEPPPDPEYFLAGKPHGACPWCDRLLLEPTVSSFCDCQDWDEDLTEDENRIRYAAERLEDAQRRQP